MTTFEEIYSLNSEIVNSPTISDLPAYVQNDIHWKQMQLGLGFCLDSLSKDSEAYQLLANINEPINIKYTYTCDGVNNQFYISGELDSETNIYVAIKKNDTDIFTEITKDKFSVDIETKTITLLNTPLENEILLIVTYTIGGFINDLDYSLKSIVTRAMVLGYWERKRNSDVVGDMTLYGSLKGYSQGNHLKAMDNVINELRKNIKRSIINYTYQ